MKRNKKLLKEKHPDARFEHTRHGNLAVLQIYLAIKKRGDWTNALETRFQLRKMALEGDAPRSLIKSWLWTRKIKDLL